MSNPSAFSPSCTACPRLAGFREEVRARHPDYYGRPVPSFGPPASPLLVVGLAPGMHGANASGRAFTGDHAGVLLYRTLYETGFSNQPSGEHPDDGLTLQQCRITNAVRCLPPQNKPTRDELRRCNGYLARELAEVPTGGVVLALGRVAHDAVLIALGEKLAAYRFAHGARHALPNGLQLLDSYHCSRYNTQTGRLTAEMFREVFGEARRLIDRLG